MFAARKYETRLVVVNERQTCARLPIIGSRTTFDGRKIATRIVWHRARCGHMFVGACAQGGVQAR